MSNASPTLPEDRATTYAISILTADASSGALESIQRQVTTALEKHGLSHLPTLHRTLDTSFVVVAHGPTELQRGDLLVTDQATGRIVLLRDGTARPYLDVSSWCSAHVWDTATNSDRSRLYVSVSGMRAPVANLVGVPGTSAVLEIDTASGQLTRVFDAYDPDSGRAYADHMLDVAGIAVTPDDRQVLMCDFNNWQGNGKVLAIDLATGELSVVTDGLDQPSSLRMDGPDHVLVANTRQPHGQASGGQIVRLDIRSGDHKVVADVSGVDASLIGVVRLADGSLVGTMSEGTQEKCVVFRAEPAGDNLRRIWHPNPGFLGSGISASPDGDSVWVAETLRRRVYELDGDGSVRRHLQVYDDVDESNIEFMFRGFDTLESVVAVS